MSSPPDQLEILHTIAAASPDFSPQEEESLRALIHDRLLLEGLEEEVNVEKHLLTVSKTKGFKEAQRWLERDIEEARERKPRIDALIDTAYPAGLQDALSTLVLRARIQIMLQYHVDGRSSEEFVETLETYVANTMEDLDTITDRLERIAGDTLSGMSLLNVHLKVFEKGFFEARNQLIRLSNAANSGPLGLLNEFGINILSPISDAEHPDYQELRKAYDARIAEYDGPLDLEQKNGLRNSLQKMAFSLKTPSSSQYAVRKIILGKGDSELCVHVGKAKKDKETKVRNLLNSIYFPQYTSEYSDERHGLRADIFDFFEDVPCNEEDHKNVHFWDKVNERLDVVRDAVKDFSELLSEHAGGVLTNRAKSHLASMILSTGLKGADEKLDVLLNQIAEDPQSVIAALPDNSIRYPKQPSSAEDFDFTGAAPPTKVITVEEKEAALEDLIRDADDKLNALKNAISIQQNRAKKQQAAISEHEDYVALGAEEIMQGLLDFGKIANDFNRRVEGIGDHQINILKSYGVSDFEAATRISSMPQLSTASAREAGFVLSKEIVNGTPSALRGALDNFEDNLPNGEKLREVLESAINSIEELSAQLDQLAYDNETRRTIRTPLNKLCDHIDTYLNELEQKKQPLMAANSYLRSLG